MTFLIVYFQRFNGFFQAVNKRQLSVKPHNFSYQTQHDGIPNYDPSAYDFDVYVRNLRFRGSEIMFHLCSLDA